MYHIFLVMSNCMVKNKESRQKKIPRLLCTYPSIWNQRQYWMETLPRVFAVGPSAGVKWYCIVACDTCQSGNTSFLVSVSTQDDLMLGWKSKRQGSICVCGWDVASVLFEWRSSGRYICSCTATGSPEDSHCKALKYTLDVLCVVYFQKWLYLNPLWH